MNKGKINKIFVISIIFLVSLSPLTILEVKAQTENTWESLADMPTARNVLGIATINEKIYAIGGHSGVPISDNEEYDPQTNRWTTKTSMPTARWDFATAVVNNKIYIIGGSVDASAYSGIHEVYNPLTDTWETKTSMPTPRGGICANVVNNKIYIIGGARSFSLHPPYIVDYYNLTEVYDPSTDSWTTKAPPPTHVNYYSSTVMDNKIYIFSNNLTQIYNPVSNTWSYGTSSNSSLLKAKAGTTSGLLAPKRIHVVRGADTQFIYDPITDSWTEGAPMITVRSGFDLVVLNDKLYAIGGKHSDGWNSKKNERYTPFSYQGPYVSPIPTPTPSSTPIPTPTPTTTPTPTPVATPTPTNSSTPTSPAIEPESFSETIAIASVAIIAVVGLGIFAYFKKRRS